MALYGTWIIVNSVVSMEHWRTQLAASNLLGGIFIYVFKYHTPATSITKSTIMAIPMCATRAILNILFTPSSFFLPISNDKYLCTAVDIALFRKPSIATIPPTTL